VSTAFADRRREIAHPDARHSVRKIADHNIGDDADDGALDGSIKPGQNGQQAGADKSFP
jgi:hypothetical protein